ncbi:MAG TPA: FtsX-like permease family protein [Firmicutes bacterium]|nr:FtsX-like permease family protein [Bacillota bacterium]
MGFTECLSLALSSIKTNKMRSGLTLLGIVIGVASVIVMISIGEGARQEVSGEWGDLGSNLILIQPDYLDADVKRGDFKPLRLEDADAIGELCSLVARVAPEAINRGLARYGSRHEEVTTIYTTSDFARVGGVSLKTGRFLNELDIIRRRRVVVLSSRVRERLFPGGNPLGRKVKLNGQGFTAIGIADEVNKGVTFTGDSTQDMLVYLPISLADRMIGSSAVSVILAQSTGADVIDQACEQIEAVLRRRYGASFKYKVQNLEAMVRAARATMSIFTAILGGIGGISLLVGGVGVMNIMLATVSERTREIGIRKAIGARRRDILRQFIVEAAVMCTTGGVVGIILGSAAARAIAGIAGWPALVSPWSVGVALFASSLVGLASGTYPAWRAARLRPVEALRYD